MEEQQGLCHLSLYSKAVFSKILHHATLPFQKERKSEYGDFLTDVMFLRRVGTRLEY